MIIVRFIILIINILYFNTYFYNLKYVILKNKKKLFYWNVVRLIAKINNYTGLSNVYFSIQYASILVLFKFKNILHLIKNWLIWNKKLQTCMYLRGSIDFSIYKISYFLLFINFCNE